MENAENANQLDEIRTSFDKSMDDFCLICGLSKILLNILENEDNNIQERDKISLATVLDRMLQKEKQNLDSISTKIFGY